ncbi:unnamed protein product [Spirodela intermedia]|uniref:Uncharacterized protein n=1 Tax=Spirodela intermedia TaxID=51605 RepID=A0A7I8IJS1_SPIIN|nr:unnamed protein product [Spirodela intermedia]CAA6657217.1 unnamed protein product [Spirodela intermedia]
MDPAIGMAFETENAAYDCYNEYAKKMGFTIRWDNRTLSEERVRLLGVHEDQARW